MLLCASLFITACTQLAQLSETNPQGPGHSNGGQPHMPLSTALFIDIPASTEMLGGLQVINARGENTFASIARHYGLGYQELKIANPTVDPWLPGENTPIYLPTLTVIPDAPRNGIVINLPSMRLLHFTQSAMNGGSLTIESYPIGIGREGWATPEGNFHITEKTRDPNWYPPASVKREHAEMGDPLPDVVPPGPDNPLGRFKMRLSSPEYLIHGTNKPSGVGMRVSHGCIRLYPEHIADLFDNVSTRAKVSIVNQPVLAAWFQGELYLEVHPPLVEDNRNLAELAHQALAHALARNPNAGTDNLALNEATVAEIIREQRGIPIPVTRHSGTTESFLANARKTLNQTQATPPAQETAAR